MPTVGGRKFEYSEEGIAEAEAYAKKMGLPMPKFDKPTSKKEKQRMVDAGNYEAIAEENAGKNMGGRIRGSGKKSPVKKNMGGKVMGYKSGGMMEGPMKKNMGGPIKGYMAGGTIKGYMGGGGVTADRGNGIAQKGIRRCKMT